MNNTEKYILFGTVFVIIWTILEVISGSLSTGYLYYDGDLFD